MSWISNSQPYIITPSGEFYNQPCLFDYPSVNPVQPLEYCQQQQQQPVPLNLSLHDYNQPYPQSLMNFQVPEFSQYLTNDQAFADNDDESDTSSDYSIPSPGEHPVDNYFSEIRSSDMEQGESINSFLQRQNYNSFVKQEENVSFCSQPLNEFDRISPIPNTTAAFSNHPLYDTFIALHDLWNSSQDGLREFNAAEFSCQAEPIMKIACSNLNTMGGSQYDCDSVIRYQIGYLLEQLLDFIAVIDPKPDYNFNPEASGIDVSVSAGGNNLNHNTTANEFVSVSVDAPAIYSECSPVATDFDAESSSDDTVKDEFVITSKGSIKRKREVLDHDGEEEDTEEDGDDDDEFCKRAMASKDVQKKRRENYAPDISFELFSWWFDNDGAAPNAQAKQELASKTGKTISQIATWYQNAKRRYSARLDDFRNLKAQHPHEVRDYGSYETFTRSQGSGSTTKRRRVQ